MAGLNSETCKLACWLAIAPALVGCSLAPRFERPATPIAETYAVDSAVAVFAGSDRASAVDWQNYFADDQLKGLINRALENNRDLRGTVLRVAEALALYGIQRAEQFPSLDIVASGTRARVPGNLNTTGQPIIGNEYRVGPSLASWELDLWGRVRSLENEALETFLSSDATRRAVTLSVIAQVADSYFILRELEERIALADRTLQSRRESHRIFSRRFAVGSTSRLDLLQVETLLQQSQTLAAQLQQERMRVIHQLTLLAGSELDLKPASRSLDEHAIARELQPGLPSDLLLARPDIVAAEHRLRAAHANIGAARAAFLPRIALTGNFGSASNELDGLFESGSRAWNFAPSLSLPIFNAGRTRASLDLAEVRRDLAVADYEKTIQSAFRDVCDALSARTWLDEQIQVAQEALITQTERVRLAQLRYESGAAAFLEVLDAQRELLSAEQQLVQLRRSLLSSRVALYAALGGGMQSLP